MSLLLETICLKEGVLQHLSFHNARLNSGRRMLLCGGAEDLDLGDLIRVPAECAAGVWRCRVLYDVAVRKIEFLPYTPRKIKSLACVCGDSLEYAYKYADRSAIDQLLVGVPADDILILQNGLITDTSCANVAFFDGTKWFTPGKPLLAGTTRARYLAAGALVEAEIGRKDLVHFEAAAIMNAMNDFDWLCTIPIKNIVDMHGSV